MLWFLGQGVAYAVGLTKLGHLGVSVGAALFMGFMIVISNVVGVKTGEWKGASVKAKKTLYTGLFVLVSAMVIMSVGTGLQQKFQKDLPELTVSDSLTEPIEQSDPVLYP